jgi:hypothetical protein
MKIFALLAALTVGSVPAMVAQTAGGGAPAPQSGAKSGSARDSVTTSDSVYNPADIAKAGSDRPANGKLPKDKGAKNNTKPVSPPNPPVVDPHENPGSPVNTPKAGDVPGNGK